MTIWSSVVVFIVGKYVYTTVFRRVNLRASLFLSLLAPFTPYVTLPILLSPVTRCLLVLLDSQLTKPLSSSSLSVMSLRPLRVVLGTFYIALS
ncbi:hypothetical protein BD769DRAFT_610878 [Suillus cothurnatus]|nr:hypothetical protein BD769DRAFT_610878 [Suillus cothurnatus]